MITPEQLALHAKWLNNEPDGVRLQAQNANLSSANLTNANLTGANLTNANLTGANMSSANLTNANLTGANLIDAYLTNANLTGANLIGAYLTNANLTGANLIGAYLRDAILRGAVGLPIVDDAPQRLRAVAATVLDGDGATLAMGKWHTCDTTHCLAGWAIHQAGTIGKTLEGLHGPHIAGLLLLGYEAAGHFYDSNEDATEWLRSVVEKN